MSQAIIRLDSSKEDAELCINSKEKTIFKNISFTQLRSIVSHYCNDECKKNNKNIFLFNDVYIGLGDDYIVIKQPEHLKFVTLLGKGYKIVFPNAIYIMRFNEKKTLVKEIIAFSYKEYKGPDTELYEYPMPNELSRNRICMGTANKEIIDENYLGALDRIISAEYTHRSFTGIKGFSNSEKWFEYLSKNKFPYKFMRKLNMKLKDVVV